MSDTEKDIPDQKKILRLYAAFAASLVLCVIPFILAAVISMGLFLGVLVAAYILRTDTKHGSLMENHMTFIIRTIWIGGLITLITMTAASVYLFYGVDNTPLDPCIQKFIAIGPATQVMELQAMISIFQGCFDSYLEANMGTFFASGFMAAGPVFLYFIVRYARGLSRALGGYRVADPNAWF